MKSIVVVAGLAVSVLAIFVLFDEWNILTPGSPQLSASTAPSPAPASPQNSTAAAPSSLAPAQEDIGTVMLRVDGMWCAACSYFVRQALMGTPGVLDAKVSSRTKTATVTYDRSKTAVAALTAATTNYGYPSQVTDELSNELDQILGRP